MPNRTPRLFNHDFRFTYPDVGTVEGIEYFSGIVLTHTNPDDVIQLHPDLAPELPAIVDHYRSAGIECTDRVVWNLSPSAALDFPESDFALHMFNEQHHQLRPNQRRLAATTLFNNKNEFISWCSEQSFAAPRTRFYEPGELPDLEDLTHPVFVKADISSTGRAVFHCESTADVLAAAATLRSPYQVQEALEAVAFVNVQYTVRNGVASYLLTSQQVLDGFRYLGTAYPTVHDPRSLTDPMAAALAAEGLEDVFGIDVAVMPGPDGAETFLALEVNPRYNGSTYYYGAAQRLSVAEWSAATVSSSVSNVADVVRRLGDLSYDPTRKSGVLAINWGRILVGKVGLLFAGTRDEQEQLRREVSAVLA